MPCRDGGSFLHGGWLIRHPRKPAKRGLSAPSWPSVTELALSITNISIRGVSFSIAIRDAPSYNLSQRTTKRRPILKDKNHEDDHCFFPGRRCPRPDDVFGFRPVQQP